MNILLSHNYYGSAAPSGENIVFETELKLLRQRGHTVIEWVRHSDDIRNCGILGTLCGALSTPWNIFSKRATKRLIQQISPDIFHVHNSFPLLSPSVFYAAEKSKTATVLTLHNYRTFCAAGIPIRNEKPCTECLDARNVMPALRHRCYRSSRTATIPLAAMIWLHRRLKTWELQVDAFIALTEFQKEIFCKAGLPRERVFVKPHFHPNLLNPVSWDDREPKVVFIGRLSVEKGCHILIEAWRRWGTEAPCLEVIGDGPDRLRLERTVNESGLGKKITFRGHISSAEVQEGLRRAILLVLPSLCFETFGIVIVEAYGLGVPVAASKLGSLPCMVQEGITGTLFEPGNPDDLLEKVKIAVAAPLRLATWGASARNEFERKYSAESNYQLLLQIYTMAIRHKKEKLTTFVSR